MKVSLKQDTLAYQLGVRPAVLCRDMGNVPVSSVVANLNKFMESDTHNDLMDKSKFVTYKMSGHPEVDGLMFYMMNHAVSVVRQKKHPYEALGDMLPLVQEYHNVLAIRGTRMFFYLLLICTRESRHDKAGYYSQTWKSLVAKYGNECMDFHKKIKGTGSTTAAETLRTMPPKTTLGNYTKFLAELFYTGSFNGGYGGKAWGAVADVLRDYCIGKLSAEMMLDTSFTLCHNNGPIFNKGMLFCGYTNHIYKVLDVQRSGQIPQMVGNKETEHHSDPELQAAWKMCHDVLGGVFSGYVDWYLVEELGSMKQYPSEKQAQQSKHGFPSKFKAKLEAEQIKKELAAKKAEAEEAMMITLMPNLKVKKIEVTR
jgi:hypothetical protein